MYTLGWLRHRMLHGTERTRDKESLHAVTRQRKKEKRKTSGVWDVDVSKGSKLRQRQKPRFQGRRERGRGGQQCRLCGLECRLSLSVPGCPFNMFDGTLCPTITFPFLVQEKKQLFPLYLLCNLSSPLQDFSYIFLDPESTLQKITYCDQAHFVFKEFCDFMAKKSGIG